MTTQKTISVGELKLCNKEPFVLVGGINVIESEIMALKVAETFFSITEELGIPYIFKASFDKANRSSIDSFRGPGLEKGLRILEKIKSEFNFP
ncbi:MAG TPA: 3-deoxy-8-phosphooctulonate synthase, partial [Deltaproteobacteria bacterium]|nr:3-deoxy-8-phosphooctulonate synthase [Deltaproteobacteria bacterium]